MSIDVYVPGSSGPTTLRDALDLHGPIDEFTIYSAHASYPWLAEYENDLAHAGSISARVGLDLLPQGAALAKLRGISKGANRDIRLVRSLDLATFHPKLYVARRGNRVMGVMGSSNASVPGFGANVEANLWFRGRLGGSEDTLLRNVVSALDKRISDKTLAGLARVFKLPLDPLPIVKPAPGRRQTADPEIALTVETDGWSTDPSFVRSQRIAAFRPKLQPLFAAADAVGEKMGNVHIPKEFWGAIDDVEDKFGPVVEMRWRFVTDQGATLFSLDEINRTFQVSGRPSPGKRSNHRAIWAKRERIALPAVSALRAIGVGGGSYPEVEYRLDAASSPPVLWLVYRVAAPQGVFNPADVLQ